MSFDDDAFDPTEDTEDVENDAGVDEVELERGYLRQADYTKKTQEVAQLRREAEALRQEAAEALALKQLMDRNPKAVIASLLGVDAEDQAEYLDPDEVADKRLKALEAKLEAQENEARFRKDVAVVAEEVGIDTTPEEVAKFMADNGGFMPLKAALKLMKTEGVAAEKAARQEEVINAKKNLGVVGASSHRGSESTPKVSSMRDAFALAAKQTGFKL